MTLTEVCMYLGAFAGALLALHFKMEWGGIALTFWLAFAGAVIGAGIKAAVIIRRCGGKLSIKIHVEDPKDEDS